MSYERGKDLYTDIIFDVGKAMEERLAKDTLVPLLHCFVANFCHVVPREMCAVGLETMYRDLVKNVEKMYDSIAATTTT